MATRKLVGLSLLAGGLSFLLATILIAAVVPDPVVITNRLPDAFWQSLGAIIIGLGTLVAALTGALVSIVGLNRSKKRDENVQTVVDSAKVIEKKADAIIVQGDKIHESTNSNYSKLEVALKEANTRADIAIAKMEGMQTVIAMLVAQRAETARVATESAHAATPPKEGG